MRLCDFDYELPKRSIAQRQLRKRDHSKLMVVSGSIGHRHFYDLPEYLRKGDVLVLNNSKVIPAKLSGEKATGGKVEILLVRKTLDKYECLIKGRNIRHGTKIILADGLVASVADKKGDKFILDFNDSLNLEKIGEMPTPPYIFKRVRNSQEYQTVYAEHAGSIAAPTAGFHFTKPLLEKIRQGGVRIVFVTLHVSLATFLPVKEQEIEEHKMDPEYYEISEDAAEMINRRSGRLFIVGTTTLKTLESSAQKNGCIEPMKAGSDLFIYPGYQFRTRPDALITNFHLPRSTLIMLACAFSGKDRILQAYELAKQNNYRFYSFGDSMLLLR